MTEITVEALPARRMDFSRVGEVLLHPLRGMRKVAEADRPTWLTPMLVLSLGVILSTVTSGYLKARAAMLGTAPLPLDFQYWTPEMQQNYYQSQQAMQGPVFLYIIPLVLGLVSLWLGWLVLAGALHLGSTLLGGRGSMGSALNVTAFVLLPFAVRDVLRVVFMLVTGTTILSPGLSGFVSGTGFAPQLLSHVDVFLIWEVILLAIGLHVADSLPRNKAALIGAGVVALLLLAQSGLGTLGAGIGDLAIQRPFF